MEYINNTQSDACVKTAHQEADMAQVQRRTFTISVTEVQNGYIVNYYDNHLHNVNDQTLVAKTLQEAKSLAHVMLETKL